MRTSEKRDNHVCTYVRKGNVIVFHRISREKTGAAHYGREVGLARGKLVFGHIAVCWYEAGNVKVSD